MKRYIYSLLCLVLTASCGKSDEPAPTPDKPVDTPARTILVYMVADNTLGTLYGCDVADLAEMRTAAEAGDFGKGGRLLVYYNRPKTNAGQYPQLLEITKRGTEILKEYPDDTSIHSVDPERVTEVMNDVRAKAPADDYGLVMWSHSNGWLGSPSTGSDKYYKAYGDDRGYHITLPSLVKALEGFRFSFIYFDCCLMGNVETAYEMRGLTDRMVASPTELGIDGMPYDQNLKYLFAAEPQLEKAAENTYQSYLTTGAECQIAVYDLTALPELASATRNVLNTVTECPDVTGIQRYNNPSESVAWDADMDNYMEVLCGDSRSDLLSAWRRALANVVTYKATTDLAIPSFRINRYCGLGAYAIASPSATDYRGYHTTSWWQDVCASSPAYREE